MRSTSCLLALALLLGTSLMACSDSGGTTTDTMVDHDGGPDGTTGGDFLPPDGPTGSALEVVVDRLLAPTQDGEYGTDIDGDGSPDNKIGSILVALSSFFDMQADLDSQVSGADFILLFGLVADSLASSPAATLQFYLGVDTDGDASDNFSGSEPFDVSPQTPADAKLSGSIASSRLEVGPGNLVVPFPMGNTTVMAELKKAQVAADVSSTGMSNGQINGAIPMDTINNEILPAIAAEMTSVYQTTTDTQTKTFLAMFDADSDDTITADEIKSNGIIGMLFQPDIDTSGDGTNDAMSFGIGFTATTAVINP